MPILDGVAKSRARKPPTEQLKELAQTWANLISPALYSAHCLEGEGPDIQGPDKPVYLKRENEWLQGCTGLQIEEIEAWVEEIYDEKGYVEDRDHHSAEVDLSALFEVVDTSSLQTVQHAIAEFSQRIAFLRDDLYLSGDVRFPYFPEDTGSIPPSVVIRATNRKKDKRYL